MSSHYIIRDDQEPALYIKDGDAVLDKAIFSLLEWNPLVIIHESIIAFVVHHRINVDAVIIEDMIEEEVQELLEIQKPYDILEQKNLPHDVLEYLSMKGMHALDIIGNFEQDSVNLAQEIEVVFPVNIFSGNIKYIRCKEEYQKWSTTGRGFIITPYTDSIETKNLLMGEKGAFKVIDEGRILIRSTEPVWIGEVLF